MPRATPKTPPPAQPHAIYHMRASQRPPVGDGDTKSWFEFYKWNVTGETMVPQTFPFLPVEKGSFIWFVMDNQLLGGALVERVETPPLPMQLQELWYNADKLLEFTPPLELDPALLLAKPVELAAKAGEWLEQAGRRDTSNPPKEETNTP